MEDVIKCPCGTYTPMRRRGALLPICCLLLGLFVKKNDFLLNKHRFFGVLKMKVFSSVLAFLFTV